MNKSIVETVIDNINENTTIDNLQNIFTINVKFDSDMLIEIIKKQQEKGLKKYGHSIDDCPNNKYNWEIMAYEEIADFLIYNQKLININNDN